MAAADALLHEMWAATGGAAGALDRLEFTGEGMLASVFPVDALAAASIGVAALAVAELIALTGAAAPTVQVDRRLAGLWFGMSLRPLGWRLPALWDPVAGDYRTRDGWIRLHTNAPRHRAAAARVLGERADRAAMQAAVAEHDAGALEAAIVAAGGCAAEMRSPEAWRDHPQGRAVAAEPLVLWDADGGAGGHAGGWMPRPDRPLAGLRVLDLTRVLAGPIATRFLAGHGARVLRIDAPDWDEAAVAAEVTPGKACARLDLRRPADRARLEALLAEADMLVHGLRPGALEGLGLGAAARRRIAPRLIDVSLDAYGWSGAWAGRRGFDSLMQMSTGIAQAGTAWQGAAAPVPLPVQALDHATGYLMAASAVAALARRVREGATIRARLSLARTAQLLLDHRGAGTHPDARPETAADLAPGMEATGWGPARRLRPPAAIAGGPMRWDRPAAPLGSAPPDWP